MQIGNVSIAHSITLAPMEEHTNYPFRLLCKQLVLRLVEVVLATHGFFNKLVRLYLVERPSNRPIRANEPEYCFSSSKVNSHCTEILWLSGGYRESHVILPSFSPTLLSSEQPSSK
jgi:hypothetical protein